MHTTNVPICLAVNGFVGTSLEDYPIESDETRNHPLAKPITDIRAALDQLMDVDSPPCQKAVQEMCADFGMPPAATHRERCKQLHTAFLENVQLQSSNTLIKRETSIQYAFQRAANPYKTAVSKAVDNLKYVQNVHACHQLVLYSFIFPYHVGVTLMPTRTRSSYLVAWQDNVKCIATYRMHIRGCLLYMIP